MLSKFPWGLNSARSSGKNFPLGHGPALSRVSVVQAGSPSSVPRDTEDSCGLPRGLASLLPPLPMPTVNVTSCCWGGGLGAPGCEPGWAG